jgi:O-antigen ligase
VRDGAADGLSLAAPRAALPLAGGAPSGPTTRIAYALALGFLLALLGNVAMSVPALAPYAPAQSLALAALGFVFVERAVARRGFVLVRPESHLLAAFVAAAALSAITALWPRHAAEHVLVLLKAAAGYLLLVHVVETWRRLSGVGLTLALGGALPVLGALSYWRDGLLEEGRLGWIGIFGNPNDLAFALVVLFPIALAQALVRRGALRALLCVVLAASAWVIALTNSRGGLIGFGVVVALCAARWAGRRALLPVLVVAAVGLALLVSSQWRRDEGFSRLTADDTVGQRLQTLRAGLAMAAARPLLGVGLGCSGLGFPLYAPPGADTRHWLQSHNTVVQALAETGVAGFVPFALLVTAGLRRAARTARVWKLAGDRDRHRLVSALEISLWGFLACGLAGGYVLSWFPYLVLGLISATRRLPGPRAGGEAIESGGARRCAASPAW